MPFAKPSAIRGYFRSSRPITKFHAWRQSGQRGYTSQTHRSSKAGGDLPWAIGAVVVTVPATWYLIQNRPKASHTHEGHGNHGDHNSHGNEHSKQHGAEKSESEPEDKGVENSGGSDNEDKDQDVDTPVTSDNGESDHVSEDSKKLNEGKPDPNEGDKAIVSKPAGSENVQSSKQENLSNTDTKHTTDITKNSEKSKKPEGAPDATNLKGTGDPNRTQV